MRACVILGLNGRFNSRKVASNLDITKSGAGRRISFCVVMKANIQAGVTKTPGSNNVGSS